MYITILKTYIHTCNNYNIYIMHISSLASQLARQAPSKKDNIINNTADIIPEYIN